MTVAMEVQVPKPVDVLLAEANPEFFAAVERVLRAHPRLRVVARAANAAGAVAGAVRTGPSVCLLDVEMPGGAVAAAWEIRARVPWARLVLFSSVGSDDDLFAGLRTGIDGFLLKDMNLERLPLALLDVHNGNVSLPRSLAKRVMSDYRVADPSWRSIAGSGVRARVTSREWEVLELLGQGLSTYEIAERLHLTPSAVRCHISAGVRKIGARDRQDAVRLLQEGAA